MLDLQSTGLDREVASYSSLHYGIASAGYWYVKSLLPITDEDETQMKVSSQCCSPPNTLCQPTSDIKPMAIIRQYFHKCRMCFILIMHCGERSLGDLC